MPQYKATFLVPAQVSLSVIVVGDNQQQGLAAVHDALRLALPNDAQVVSMDLASFELDSFQRCPVSALADPSSTHEPSSPLSASDTFSVTFHFGSSASSAVGTKSLPILAYGKAKALADDVLVPYGPYGYAAVHDRDGALRYFNQAPRGGGWEVEAVSCRQSVKDKLCTGIADENLAKAEAMRLFLTKDFAVVRVLDATIRVRPALVVRELRR
jgi:hypothetical protein